jgi:hypothetical protein
MQPEALGTSSGAVVIDCFPDLVDGSFKGNETMYINDAFGPQPKHGPKRKYNCFFLEIKHNGWPFVFVATHTNVNKGEELLIDYGDLFHERFSKTTTRK